MELIRIGVEFGVGLSVKNRNLSITVPKGSTVNTVLRCLEIEHGVGSEIKMKANGSDDFTPQLLILLNGQNTVYFSGRDTPVSDGDSIMILAMLIGG